MFGIHRKDVATDEIRIPEIIRSRIIPVITRYETILVEDVESISDDYRLGEISQEDLKKNLESLKALKRLLEEFAKGPNRFKVVARNESHVDGDRYSLTLKRPTDPERLPREKSKAVTELKLSVVVSQGPYESRDERIRSAALRRPPEEAILRVERYAPREISVSMSTVSAYYDEKIGRPRVDFHSGVVVSLSPQEGIMLQGMVYVGATRHFTHPLPEKDITRDECEVLGSYVITRVG